MLKLYDGKQPVLAGQVYIADTAQIVGDVELRDGVSIWYNVVMRGDVDRITVLENTNIQDNTVIHVDAGFPCTLGLGVTVGHGSILHGCTVGDDCLIGMGAIILDGAEIGAGCMIGAGALVAGGAKIPPGSLVLGVPGTVVRQVTEEERMQIKEAAAIYADLARKYFSSFSGNTPG